MSHIPDWTPEQKPIYDINKTYDENFTDGPFFYGQIPARRVKPAQDFTDFLGFKVNSKIGVPAGPLLNSRWVDLAGKLGFDILTYKTMRSRAHACHPLPNMIYVESEDTLKESNLGKKLLQRNGPPTTLSTLSVTNSFGMPSKDNDFLMADIEKASRALGTGQIMVVSTVGTAGSENFADDFARSAALAKEAGAKIIEANFSCPNVATGEGSVFTHPETVAEITKKIVREIKDIPFIIKVGYFKDPVVMEKVFVKAAQAGARAISGINTIGMPVVNRDGTPALGSDRPTSGICGNPIRNAATDFIKKAREINNKHKLDLTIIGVGGITLPEHFDEFFKAGADVTMSATGMMWDPYLALRYHNIHSQ
jgi:dihydroorotate dehydrogenase (NAD+) catalytic subunit